jgi:hypothetical protein
MPHSIHGLPYWLSKLTYDPRRFKIELLADMLEETGWFESDFQSAFKELLSEKKVASDSSLSLYLFKKSLIF